MDKERIKEQVGKGIRVVALAGLIGVPGCAPGQIFGGPASTSTPEPARAPVAAKAETPVAPGVTPEVMQAVKAALDVTPTRVVTDTVRAQSVMTDTKKAEVPSVEAVWGDQDEFAIVFGDKPFGNRTAHTVIQIVRQGRDAQGRPGSGSDVKTTTHIFLEAGYVLRVPYEGLASAGAEWEVWGPKDQVLFRMEGMAEEVRRRDSGDEKVDPYMLYVGNGEAPKGFTKQKPAWGQNWKVQIFPNVTPQAGTPVPSVEQKAAAPAEKKVEEKKAVWSAGKMVRDTNGVLELKPDQGKSLVFQGWDPKTDARSTFQVVIESGRTAKLSGTVEGTYWQVENATSAQVITRALEMEREKEDAFKKDPKVGQVDVKTYWVGQGKAPEGLREAPAIWTAK